jgi:hypothetical protein
LRDALNRSRENVFFGVSLSGESCGSPSVSRHPLILIRTDILLYKAAPGERRLAAVSKVPVGNRLEDATLEVEAAEPTAVQVARTQQSLTVPITGPNPPPSGVRPPRFMRLDTYR